VFTLALFYGSASIGLMRILLVQSRNQESNKGQEFRNVLHSSGLSSDEVILVDSRKGLDQKLLNQIDGIILGATSSRCINTESPENLLKSTHFLMEARNKGISMLGFNYGAHLLSIAFGGSVCHDHHGKEIGTYEVKKTEHANNDPIFGVFSSKFDVQKGHYDHMETIPSGADVILVSGESECECWVFRGEGIYAMEFQPDLDQDTLTRLLIDSKDTYAKEPGELEHCILSLRPTPEAKNILKRFISEVVEKQGV